SAKFRMDDSKLANGPVKVRCAKCKEVFVVQKEEEPADSFQLPTDFDVPSSAAAPASSPTIAGEPPASAQEPSGTAVGGFSAGDSEFSFNMEAPAASDASMAAVSKGHEGTADEFDFKDSSAFEESAGSGEFDQAAATPSDFDFGDIPLGEPSPPVQPEAATATGQDEFAIDFGEVSFSETPVAETAPTSFDFSFSPDAEGEAPVKGDVVSGGADDFTLSFSPDSTVQAESPSVEESKTEATFGDFTFGEAQASQEPKPFPVPPADQGMAGFTDDFSAMPIPDEELPPTTLTTRKKRGSLFPLFVIIGAILLIVALAGSGVYFFGGPKVFSKVGLGFLVEWYGQKGGEEGDITLRNVKAEYVINKEAGELFVVRGEALNNYKKPRASIQIKVALLGSNGSSLKTKAAFCGNPLSNEQLATMPPAKIEEVMNNQFGDSLANLGVKPGNTIPFVVVVSGIPKETSDFSVQVGGSTVATQ
ncbi:MAG TPA: DUF3426 domain-containing protein, partial [Geobacteraceae bacterium]|nr:DUF3426 domain-containing protein [Geobacteraceae bacterium]